MLRDALVEYCAPTLAGIKTGNLFTIQNSAKDINAEMRELNKILTRRGLRLIPVRSTNKSTLVYLYRPDCLRRDLKSPEAMEILEEKGYPCENSDCCIVRLVEHLKHDENFPHEIGLFLGYPPSDVKGFIKNPRKGVKCIGCWKVYGNECEARKTFEKYDRCRDTYRREAKQGKPLEALIVDTRRDVRLAI